MFFGLIKTKKERENEAFRALSREEQDEILQREWAENIDPIYQESTRRMRADSDAAREFYQESARRTRAESDAVREFYQESARRTRAESDEAREFYQESARRMRNSW